MHVQIDNKEGLLSYLEYCTKTGRRHQGTRYETLNQKLEWIGTDYPFHISLGNNYGMSKYGQFGIIAKLIEGNLYLKEYKG